jgi:hypothetical protein
MSQSLNSAVAVIELLSKDEARMIVPELLRPAWFAIIITPVVLALILWHVW